MNMASQDVALKTLLEKLNVNLGLDETQNLILQILSSHESANVLKHFENLTNVSEECILMKVYCLFCRCGDKVKLQEWMREEELNKKQFGSFLDRIVRISLVQEYTGREDIGFNKEDFNGLSTKAFYSLHILQSLWDIVQADNSEGQQNQRSELVIKKCLVLVLQHSDVTCLWTDKGCHDAATSLLNRIYQYKNCASLSKLLCKETGNEPAYFSIIAEQLLPKLTASHWKQNPGACKVFSICLLEIKFPDTSLYLHQLLPFSLLLSDDHELDNKVLGALCLHHIVSNATAAELSLYARLDVVFASLDRLLYTHEPQLLDVLLPCMLDTLKTYEKLPSKKNDSLQSLSKADETFSRILSDMLLEDKLAQRRIYSQHLISFIEFLGIKILRHSKKLFTVIDAFLEISDGQHETSRLNILNALICVIRTAWPTMETRCEQILRLLVRLVHELAVDKGVWDKGVKGQLLEKCEKIVELLHVVCPNTIRSSVDNLMSVKTTPACDQIIHRWHTLCMHEGDNNVESEYSG